MESFNPKVSFIPKGSLVREESFLERRRPRSVMGIIAGVSFVLALGSYFTLYYLNNSLNQLVVEKTTEIKSAQKEFSDAPEVGAAKTFRARVELARELLNKHTVVSPIFTFLSESTLSSVIFERFTFRGDPTMGTILELTGEAPTYGSLAYQLDILREKVKEVDSFTVKDVHLTNFGTVAFSLQIILKPEFLSYSNNLKTTESPVVAPVSSSTIDTSFTPSLNFDIPQSTTTTGTMMSTTSASGTVPVTDITASSSQEVVPLEQVPVVDEGSTTTPSVAVESAQPQSTFWGSLWSKLKFW